MTLICLRYTEMHMNPPKPPLPENVCQERHTLNEGMRRCRFFGERAYHGTDAEARNFRSIPAWSRASITKREIVLMPESLEEIQFPAVEHNRRGLDGLMFL